MNTNERRGTPPMKMFVHGRPERRFAMSRVNPLMGKGNYTATLNNMKLVHWPLMGGLLS